jgi:hypothetical protein
MIEALMRGAVLFLVRVFCGCRERYRSDGAETVPWKDVNKSKASMVRCRFVCTILDTGDFKSGHS